MVTTERVMIFVDHNNLFHEFMRLGIKYDYIKLKNIIMQKRNLTGMFVYMGIEPSKTTRQRRAKKAFYQTLRKNNIIPITELIKIYPDGTRKEKGIDIALAVDMISNAYDNKFDRAILVSGDGDFKPAITKLIALGKNVEIWSFKKALSSKLKSITNQKNIFYIDNIINQVKK